MAEFISPSLIPQTLKPYVLSGWKDIANYLGRGVRTVQRYERKLRLPVQRPRGRSRGSVMATRADLDGWVSQSPTRPPELAGLRSQQRDDLKRGVSALLSLCAETHELQTALGRQRTELESGIGRIARSLSGSGLWEAEKYRTTAMEQKERATKMIETARKMSDRAIDMRKPPRRQLIENC